MERAGKARAIAAVTWGRMGRLALLVGCLSIAIAPAVTAEPPAPPETGVTGRDDETDRGDVLRVRSVAVSRDGRSTPDGSGPGLDELLRLPSDFQTRAPSHAVAGTSEQEWRHRFERAEAAIHEARKKLVETKQELDGLAQNGGANQWSVAPPGAGAQQSTSPLSFKLREELKRNREALVGAERGLRELKIEADLAGVPAEWRVVAARPATGESPSN